MLRRILYLASIVIMLCAFNFAHNLTSGWQRQDLPSEMGGRTITDMCFTDSLTGFMASSRVNDTSYILKTTNSGFNWNVIHKTQAILVNVQFLNSLIGYVGGSFLLKTTNGGTNWFTVNTPFQTYQADFYVLNEDTIWFAMDEAKTGGIFRTINGGQNWVRQFYSGGTPNPDRIYFFNKNLGFASRGTLFRTSNGGENWMNMTPEQDFHDIHFINESTGWKLSMGSVRKTTNGGINWLLQTLPAVDSIITSNGVERISHIPNSNTIYGVGPRAYNTIAKWKGVIFKTTNGGTNWGYQIPDTNLIKLKQYNFVYFLDTNRGWAYRSNTGGIYTIQGGDSTIYTSIKNISSEIPTQYKLEQNYPNPFNPATNIKFNILKSGFVNLSIYDINGRLISILVNENLKTGEYKADFNATGLSSGIYFYTLFVNNYKETKRMMLVK